jgi:DNA end-binding protein Ku
MPRAIWNGSLSFGLVNVPVQLFSATDEKDIHFNQFEKGTGKRIHYKRVAEDSDKEVAYKNIVKGYEVSDGKFVIVTPEELESVEPGKSRTSDIEDFIDLSESDPVSFE